jgi:oxygen-independent coproporphyrinogen-3 oxidase
MAHIALYIHIPWCIKKCPYCDFNSHNASVSPDYNHYVKILLRDLDHQLSLFPDTQKRELSSIFIGGGTPSLCPGDAMRYLLEGVFQRFVCSSDIEVTIEANPGTAESSYFEAYVQAGINRISLGLQSFNDTSLQRLGRIHSSKENFQAVEKAKAAGFQRINIDVMYALPEQTLAMALSDVNSALACEVEHISYYQLTLEENTLFYRQVPKGIPSEDLCWDIATQGSELLHANQFTNYEVSAWSRGEANNSQCRHNVNYWKYGDYIGIGAGAHGKLSFQQGENLKIIRTQQISSPTSYIEAYSKKNDTKAKPLKDFPLGRSYGGMRTFEVSKDEILFEYMLNRLRLNSAFSIQQCQQMTGLAKQKIQHSIDFAIEKDFLKEVSLNMTYQKTQLGNQFLNDLIWGFSENG